MRATRCTECGDTRWMLRKRSGDPGSCVLCGGTVVEERRYPGRDKREVEGAEVTERRTVAGPSDVPAT